MEEFLKINWNPVVTNVQPFVTTEYLKEHSCLYKVLNDKNFNVFSSDSSDDELEESEKDKRQSKNNKKYEKKDGIKVRAVTQELEENGTSKVGDNMLVSEDLPEGAVDQPSGGLVK